jgi:hypothetical protein
MLREGWVPPSKPWFESKVLTAESIADNFDHTPQGHNRWLEDKFRQDVPDALLNLAQKLQCGKYTLLPESSEARAVLDNVARNDCHCLRVPEPSEFGSATQLQRDHAWVARYNQAVVINALAIKDFQARKQEIMEWYADRVQERKEFLIDQVCRMDWPIELSRYSDGFSTERVTTPCNWIAIEYDSNGRFQCNWWHISAAGDKQARQLIGTYNCHRRAHECAINGSRATLSQVFAVESAAEISLITGVPVAQLPEPLQHYEQSEPYAGNPILDRIDPMDWVLEDPWRELRLPVRVVLSKSGFNARRRQLRLPRFTAWETLRRWRE